MVEFTNINTLNSTKMDKYCLNRNQQVVHLTFEKGPR